MLLRLFRVTARRVASSRLLWVLVLVLQVLYLLPVLGESYLEDWRAIERAEVENVRLYASSEALDGQAYSVDNPVTAWLSEGDQKKAAAADRMIERYDAGDAHGYFEAAAAYYRVLAETGGYSGSRSTLDRAESYQALADSGASELYMTPDHMPASLYAAFEHKLLLAFPGVQLPLVYTAEGDGMMTYNGQYELLFWMAPLVAVSALGASLQIRRRLATQAPCAPRRRLLFGALVSALLSLAVLVVICAPALVVQTVCIGVGDLSYPVLFGSGSTLAVSTVGEVLARNVLLIGLVSLMVSLAMHMSASLFDSVVPSIALIGCMVALPLFPDYYGEFSRYRDVAPYLPSSYLWTEYAAGSLGYATFPSPRLLDGVTFERGCLVLGATVLVSGVLLALLAPLGALVSWGDRGPRRPGRARAAAAASDAGGVMSAGATAPVGRISPMKAEAAALARWLSEFRRYAGALARMLLAGPGLYVLAAVMAAALVVPAIFSTDPNTSEFSHARYEAGPLRALYGAQASGAYAEGSPEAAMIDRLADALSGYVYAATPQEGYESLAEYERLRLEVAGYAGAGASAPSDAGGESSALDGSARVTTRAGDSAAVRSGRAAALEISEVEPVGDPILVEGKIALLEAMASQDAPAIYSLSTLMPGSFYLSFVFGVTPFLFWLVPAVAVSVSLARLRCRGSLIQQAPVSAGVELAAGCFVASLLAIAMLVLVIVPGTAYATMRHGIGDWGQPVVFIQSGAVVQTTVRESLLSGAGMEMLASAFVVVFLSCIERVTKSFRSVCVAAALACGAAAMAVQASLLAPADGLGAMVLGWFPLTYLDVARVVGAASYSVGSGCGVSCCAGVVVLAVSIACLLVAYMVALRFASRKARRAARIRERSCVIRI